MKKHRIGIISLILVLFLFTGCSKAPAVKDEALDGDKTPDVVVEAVDLTISAAASLTDCLEELKTMYIDKNDHVDITYNFGPSGGLQQQIEQGAPADVFISAGKKQMTALVDGDFMINDSVKDILENKLTLITHIDGVTLTSMDDLTNDDIEKIAVGEPGSVPVGQYTDEALKNLDLFDKVESKLVFAKDVREVLSWVETGNAEVGFVYQTDAQISHKVKIDVVAPEGSHKPVIYPLGVVKATKVADEAQAFVDYLFTKEAQDTFIKYGFTPLS